MQAVTGHSPALHLVIWGKFWDSQIYSGTLYVFGLSGELVKFSWPKLIADLPVPTELRVAADVALLSNRTLYEQGSRRLLSDPQIRLLLINKFQQLADILAERTRTVTADDNVKDNFLPFPHNDSEIYRSTLYVGASDGLFSLKNSSGRRSGLNVVRHSDAPALGIAAGFHTMAQASGSDGLIEARLAFEDGDKMNHSIRTISNTPCVNCEFAFLSVIASQPNGSIYLASFQRIPEDDGLSSRRRRFVRKLDRIIPQEELFKNERVSGPSFRWGTMDKLFRYTAGRIEVIRYEPRPADDTFESPQPPVASVESPESEFSFLSDIDIDDSGGAEDAVC